MTTRRPGRTALAAFLACAFLPASLAAKEERRTTAVIRDAEIEQLLSDYLAPSVKAAGLRGGSVKVLMIPDRSFNAFVADGRHIFVNAGALMETRTPNEMIGVLAHETGHIAGGHLARMQMMADTAGVLATAGTLLGAGAAIGAGRSNQVGGGGVGVVGAVTGPSELVRRSLLGYQRSEEQAADRAAMTYLQASGQSPKGMIEVFRRLGESSGFIASTVDPYILSHPLPKDRIANLEDVAQRSPFYGANDPAERRDRHDLARAKLVAFTEGPDSVVRRYPARDESLAARYARAISAYRGGRSGDALGLIEGLIKARPGFFAFHELKGQVLLESGRAREAVAPLRRAVGLAPSQGLVRMLLGQALVGTGTREGAAAAVRELSQALQREPDAAEGQRFLGLAYAALGEPGKADLASAQYSWASGNYPEARRQAMRAKEALPARSPGWLKADDLLEAREPDRK